MELNRIFLNLRVSPLAGEAAHAAARAGFLRWSLSLPDDSDVRSEARLAIAWIENQIGSTPASRAFEGYLQQAATPITLTPRRRNRSRQMARLH